VMRIRPPYVDTQTLPLFASREHYLTYADRRVASARRSRAPPVIERPKDNQGST